MEKEVASTEKKPHRPFSFKLGLGLLIFSLLLYLIPVITPFTPLSIKVKAGIITGGIVIAEVSFWLGALLVGKEVASKFKRYLNPKNWGRKRGRQNHE